MIINNDNSEIEEHLPKTFNLKLNKKKHKDLLEVLLSLSLVNKNLYNTTLFIVKNMYSAYIYDKNTNTYSLKLDKLLHDNQKSILLFINNEITNFNKINLDKYNKKKAKLKTISKDSQNTLSTLIAKPKEKQLKSYIEYKSFTGCINQEVYNQLLNSTFLQYLVERFSKKQSKRQNLEFSDYELLPGRVRQQCVLSVIDNNITYYKSVKAFSSNIGNYNSYPKPPKYMSKNMGKTFEFPGADLGSENKLVKLKNIENLYKDYDKKVKLSPEEITSYNDFSYTDLLDTLKQDHGLDITEQPLLLRFTPKSGKTLKIQTVFNTNVKIKPNTILGKTITALKSTENTKKYTNLLSSKNTSIVKALKTIPNKELLNNNISGIDLGITNILSVSYYSNSNTNSATNTTTRGQIYSAKDYTKRINTFNRKLDSIQKKLANKAVLGILEKQSTLKEEKDKIVSSNKDTDIGKTLSQLQTTKENNKLTKTEINLLHQYQKSIYEDIKYRQILDKKNNFVNDYIHKLTTCVVQNLIKNQIQLVIVGKTLGWKTNTDMGKKMNRAFYSIPHAQIINILRYKCYENNILLVTTEESYTSKTSFINNAKLKEFDRNNNSYTEQSEFVNIYELEEKINIIDKNDESVSINNNVDTKIKISKKPDTIKVAKLKINNFGGLRDPKQRNRFKNSNHTNNSSKAQYTFIHSDLNGAYNIIRKVVGIEYDKKYCSRKCDILYTNELFKQKIKQSV